MSAGNFHSPACYLRSKQGYAIRVFLFGHPAFIARQFMYAFSIRCAASGSPRCPAHEDVPTGIFSSNPFDFKQFRTLLRNGVSPTPFPSITSALFPRQWKGEDISCPSARLSSLATVSPVFATLTIPPRGAVYRFHPNSGRVRLPNRKASRVACIRPRVTNQESRVTHRPIAREVARCHNCPVRLLCAGQVLGNIFASFGV